MIRVINAQFADGLLYSFAIENGKFLDITRQAGTSLPAQLAADLLDYKDEATDEGKTFDAYGKTLLPGMIDVHIHSRAPGMEHKEDWQSLARGAFKGGVVTVFDMPNTIPPTMDRQSVQVKAELASASGLGFKFFLGVGARNIDTLAALLQDRELPLAGLKVYYGQSTGELMYSDLKQLAKALKTVEPAPLIVFHSEDQCAIDKNTALLGLSDDLSQIKSYSIHSRIRSSSTAMSSTKTILDWALTYAHPIHIAHLSTPGEVELIAEAKAKGVNVTSEVAPHHLLFSIDDYETLGPYVKMNPPVRSRAEVDQLCRYVGQGLIDIFATDHAPHTRAEKDQAYKDCPSGVPGIEFFVPLLMKVSEVTGLSLEKAVAMGSDHAAKRFRLPNSGRIALGYEASFTLVERRSHRINDEEVVSKCGWTPYDGVEVPSCVVATWRRGRQCHRLEKHDRRL